MHICVYIYIYRTHEKEHERGGGHFLNSSVPLRFGAGPAWSGKPDEAIQNKPASCRGHSTATRGNSILRARDNQKPDRAETRPTQSVDSTIRGGPRVGAEIVSAILRRR